MNPLRIAVPLFLVPALAAQNVAVFPDEYAAVPEGPYNSPNLPLARGTSRVQCLYEDVDLAIPVGQSIQRLGFRQDGSTSATDAGETLQLEIRMGWSSLDHQSMSTTFDNNFDATPTTVFGPALFTLPNLRDPAAPLTNGMFFIDLSTPFAYVPNGRNLVVEYRVFGTAGGGAAFTYRLDRADYYSPVSYGPAGCMHAGGGVPDLEVDPVRPGLQYRGKVVSAPANAPAFLAVDVGGLLTTPYPLAAAFPGIGPACTGQIDPTGVVLLGTTTSGGGIGNWSFQVPNDNVWADVHISAQALLLDFFAPGQVVVSNGGQVRIGVRNRTSIVQASGAPTAATTGSKSTYYCPVAFFVHQ